MRKKIIRKEMVKKCETNVYLLSTKKLENVLSSVTIKYPYIA